MQAFSVPLGGSKTVTAAPEDAAGNPGGMAAGNVPTWKLHDGSTAGIVSITPSTDGLSAVVQSTGGPGSVEIDVTGLNSAGQGFTSTFEVDVQQAPATQFVFSAS